MKRFNLIIFILFVFFNLCEAQTGDKTKADSFQAANKKYVNNTVYVELLGSAAIYSFNYERRLGNRFWGRIGVGYYPGPFGELATVPLGVSYLIGKEAKFFELGLVVTPLYAEENFDLFSESENEDDGFGVILSPTIGYRYQPQKEKNLFFKIAFTPLITTLETTFVPSGGLSFGYSF